MNIFYELLKFSGTSFEEIIEGDTRILVPKRAMTDLVPPSKPAFFNPKAHLSRDLSLITYFTFLQRFDKRQIFLDGMAGVGSRGLRTANELGVYSIVNDLNPTALAMAEHSAAINDIKNIEFFNDEICRFFAMRSRDGKRGTIVDIDPFGSPVEFFDCGLRATMHNGMISMTATDLQVLHGLANRACVLKYGGVPIRTTYGNEIAIRLILGSLRTVAGRLNVKVTPLFVYNNMHYYRLYVQVFKKTDQTENIGYIIHCSKCGHRHISSKLQYMCNLCNSETSIGGPLWIGTIFDDEFVKNMLSGATKLKVNPRCEKIIDIATRESNLPATYYTLDEVSAKTRTSPPKLTRLVCELNNKGFASSPTIFDPTGFRTTANIEQISSVFTTLNIC